MQRLNRAPMVLATVLLLTPGALPTARSASAADERCFAETKQCISGRFRQYWEQNGGLQVFGLPITPARDERNRDTGKTYLTQWFERNRLEYHPEAAAPYDVLLGRLGDDRLLYQGVNWQYFPRESVPAKGCLWFGETGHNVCDQEAGSGFKTYWQNHGLADPRLTSHGRSVALFGLPLTAPRLETNSSGDTVLVQWFERARFEYHPTKPAGYKVLLGRLGDDLRRDGEPGLAITGTVLEVSNAARPVIILSGSANGVTRVIITLQTRLALSGSGPATVRQIRTGMRIQAWGQRGPGDALEARQVLLGLTIGGVVKEISPVGRRLIRLREPVAGYDYIAVNPDTTIVFPGGQPATARDIQPSDIIQVSGHPSEGPTIESRRIIILEIGGRN